MRIRLVAALTTAVFLVPVTAASASAAPRPHHECPASTDLIQHKCGK
jgi:hypothetical protein